MKSIAEERKLKTDQLLLTAPVKISSIVLGKFFAMLTVFAVPLVISCICPFLISKLGTYSSLSVDYAVIFSVLCFGAMLLSVGMFISSLTDNQLIAAVVTVLLFFLFNMWKNIVGLIPTTPISSFVGFIILSLAVALIFYIFTKDVVVPAIIGAVGVAATAIFYFQNSAAFEGLLGKVLMSLSVTQPIINFASYSTFDLAGIFLYVSFTALFLFLTAQVLQKRRWS